MVKTDYQPTSILDMERRVQAFEDFYGVPSERMVEAFMEHGELVETADFHTWSTLAQTLAALRER